MYVFIFIISDDWTLAVSAKVRCPKLFEYFKEFLGTEEGKNIEIDPEKYKKYMPEQTQTITNENIETIKKPETVKPVSKQVGKE